MEEIPKSTLTTDVYYNTKAGFEDLVRSCYPLLRNINQNRVLVLNGTDVFQHKVAGIQSLWQLLYSEIARTNTVVSRAEDIRTMAAALKDARILEAKFLRALCLFYVVQQWGDIPMPLAEITTPSKDFPLAPAADIYKQIIADLLDYEAKLPVVASNYGRITKGAAQFLLSRVYLARGWNYNRLNVYENHLEIVKELTDLLTKQIRDGRSTKGKNQTNEGPSHWSQLTWLN